MLQVLDNHVISYTDPDTWYKFSKVGKTKAFGWHGKRARITIGADDADPQQYTSIYRNKFDLIGVPVKRHLGSFVITEDAKLQPGTRLYANHFVVGQRVTCSGRSIDWGFEGGLHRWGMRGGTSDQRGNTKTHRRIGSIGSQGPAKVWPGKRMPGHMGWEWVRMGGLKIIRINTQYQVIYVLGNGVPGETGEVVLMRDTAMCREYEWRTKAPPFPTFFPDQVEEPPPVEQFSEKLFQMTLPSIAFEKGKDEDYATVTKKGEVKKAGQGEEEVIPLFVQPNCYSFTVTCMRFRSLLIHFQLSLAQ